MKILIVKNGALGDVLRMSYFPRPLQNSLSNSRITWLTRENAKEILLNNPYIFSLKTNIEEIKHEYFDIIYSFDDEFDIVKNISSLKNGKIVGAYFDGAKISYTDDTSDWFDMGLLSKYGKTYADILKKNNTKTYGEIFSGIMGVVNPDPQSYFILDAPYHASLDLHDTVKIGINPYAGERWPSKTLLHNELILLIDKILAFAPDVHLYLFGMDGDYHKNKKIMQEFNSMRLHIVNSNGSLNEFAANVSRLDVMISSDSLGMHMAIAHEIPFIAFFTSTSAAEIDDYGFGKKIKSTALDYCSYIKDADNSSITAERIFNELTSLKIF
ncbi:glycosyltransferase family 9 protein [Polynucleobacter sp. 80A-SIGWE]|uniref:glycosyltransferase family 9 protein n=1 Tax=Polynucleobacter sp. 80A-SIGWE TaxID=2689100 RepID=UPI001C0D799C|nr:glycosyltransferase family 9 protein [Polynucleobacter sp. 80A-SIGWE]MBU3589072.1 glycosyltransferase family 9 protein [Polynucleobacter sp. 80A-SIGWE]